MKKLNSNVWILIIATLLFVLGAVLMSMNSDTLSSISHCCF